MTAYAAAPALAAAAKAQRKVKRKRWKEMMNEGREEKGKNLRFSKKEGLTVIKTANIERETYFPWSRRRRRHLRRHHRHRRRRRFWIKNFPPSDEAKIKFF